MKAFWLLRALLDDDRLNLILLVLVEIGFYINSNLLQPNALNKHARFHEKYL